MFKEKVVDSKIDSIRADVHGCRASATKHLCGPVCADVRADFCPERGALEGDMAPLLAHMGGSLNPAEGRRSRFIDARRDAENVNKDFGWKCEYRSELVDASVHALKGEPQLKGFSF